MSLTTAKFECKECGEFTATSEEWTKCKCGKCEVKPSKFSTSYRGEKYFNLIESDTCYFESDFFQFDDHLNQMYEKIKITCKELGFFVHEMIEKGKDGEIFLDVISISKSGFVSTYASEKNEISFWCRLGKEYGNPTYENIENRFKRFINFLELLKNEQIKIENRKNLVEFAEENRINWNESQVEEYDYTFNF